MNKKPTQQISAPDAPAREVAAEWVPITELKPWKDNPRKNDGEPVRKVAESIKRFGFSSPIIARANGEIIAGHTRWKAAQSLKLDRVPVRFLDLEPDDAHLLAIADNRTAQEAEWDDDVLKAVLGQLESQGADLAATGFDAKELEALLAEVDNDADKDGEVIEPPIDPITKPGDLWLLGEHRLLCGDSTKAEDVERLMAGSKADAVITDPPYGTGINAAGGLGNSRVAMNLVGDHDASLARKSFAQWKEAASIQVWWGANYYSDVIPGISSWAVWDKDHHGMTFADAELAYVNVGGPIRVFRHAWSGNHRASEKNVSREHPTQKPVALYAWVFETWAPEATLIADPFLGSGTTLIAAEQLGRKCYGMEISPQYCDVIVRRWETMTGQTAVREPAVAEA
jgi:hypothetical protein